MAQNAVTCTSFPIPFPTTFECLTNMKGTFPSLQNIEKPSQFNPFDLCTVSIPLILESDKLYTEHFYMMTLKHMV